MVPADSRLPDVTALASRSLNVALAWHRLTPLRRIPLVDSAAWVPRLEQQTLRGTSSCFSIVGRAAVRRYSLVGGYLLRGRSPLLLEHN